MEYFSTSSAASRRASGCIIVGVYEDGKLGVAAADIDAACGSSISKLVKQGDISGAPGKCTVLTAVTRRKSAATGRRRRSRPCIRKFSIDAVPPGRKAVRAATRSYLEGTKSRQILNCLTLESPWQVPVAHTTWLGYSRPKRLSALRFTRLPSK